MALLPVATWLPQVLTSEDLERNPRRHCRHPRHFQELKISGEELIVLNPQPHMSLANSLLEVMKAQWPGEARMPGTECNWPSIWDFGLNWHKLVNRDFKPRGWVTGTIEFSCPEDSENRSEHDVSDQLGAVLPEVKASAKDYFRASVALRFCEISTSICQWSYVLMQRRYSLGVSTLPDHQWIYYSQSIGRILWYDIPAV